MNAWAKSLSILLPAALTACIMVPVSERTSADSRDNIADEVPSFIVAGRTTRSDVLLRLGEPDGATEDDRQFVYRKRTYMEGHVSYPLGTINVVWRSSASGRVEFNDAISGILTVAYDQLIIEFDERSVVSSSGHERVQCTEAFKSLETDDQCMSVNNLDLKLKFSGAVIPYAHWCRNIGIDGLGGQNLDTLENCAGGHLAISDTGMHLYADNASNKSAPVLTLPYREISSAEEVRWTRAYKGVSVKKIDGTQDTIVLPPNKGARDTARVMESLQLHGKPRTKK